MLRVSPDLPIGSQSGGGSEDSTMPDVVWNKETETRSSLKTEIAQALGIDALHIRLMHHGCPMADDEKTLKRYGIVDGETLHLRVHKPCSAGRNDVVLACAAKKCMERAELDKDEKLCLRPYAMQPPSARARLSQRCEQSGARLEPKWVSQEHPKLFAPVGIGLDGHGNDKAYEDFNLQGIWTAPVDHPNQRGANQYGFQRVRESVGKRGFLGGA